MILLRTLGGLSLFREGSPLPASASQRRRLAILALLARTGQAGMAREKLLAYLWPERPEASARHALDQLLYATRRDLGRDAVLSEGGRLSLDENRVRSDAAQFEASLLSEDWERAVGLYTGPFLDGVHVGGGGELERWVESERQHLEAGFHAALEHLATEATQRGDLAKALDAWRRRAGAEPTNARVALELMRALVGAGERVGAVRHAQRYALLVREELEVEPDAAVLAFAEQLALDSTPSQAGSSDALAEEPPAPRDRAGAGGYEESAAGEGQATPGEGRANTGDQRARAEAAEVEPRVPARVLPTRHWTRLVVAAALVAVVTTVSWTRQSTRVTGEPPPRSIAVLAFEDLSAGGSGEYLGDGMSEELIHALAQVPELRVLARTSTFAFKDRRVDIRDIARALGAETIVEGSVRREGRRLRITAQLIEAESGYHLWSGSYDRPVGEELATQDEIARAIVRTLRPRLTGEASAPSSPHPSAGAYNLYLQGRYARHQGTEASMRAAVRLFERAIAEDSSYAAAYVGLAETHDGLADAGFAPAEPSYRRAESALRRALEVDPKLAEAYALSGHLRFHRWDWRGAEDDLQRALELNPGEAGTYAHYALPLVLGGRFDEGLAMMRKAQDLDPLALGKHTSMGWLLFLSGRHDEAIDQLQAVIAMDSTRASPHARLGLSLIELGRHEEGIASLERAVELDGGYYRSALPMLGYAYAKAGRRADAERIRGRVEREMIDREINPYYAAAFMAALGNADRAFALLDHAYVSNKGCLIDLGVDPIMKGLRPDARFASLMDALGRNTEE